MEREYIEQYRTHVRIALVFGMGIVILLVCSVPQTIFRYFARSQGYSKSATCQSNLGKIGLAHFHYSQDYDERMPLVNVHDAAISAERPLGWADALQPYLKSTEVLQCPAQADTGTPRQPNETGYTDYWHNASLAGVDRTSLRYPAMLLLIGDGNDDTDATNARYSLSELPAAWHNAAAPAKRHLDGANYIFADGHVKWITVGVITKGLPTFDLQ